MHYDYKMLFVFSCPGLFSQFLCKSKVGNINVLFNLNSCRFKKITLLCSFLSTLIMEIEKGNRQLGQRCTGLSASGPCQPPTLTLVNKAETVEQ